MGTELLVLKYAVICVLLAGASYEGFTAAQLSRAIITSQSGRGAAGTSLFKKDSQALRAFVVTASDLLMALVVLCLALRLYNGADGRELIWLVVATAALLGLALTSRLYSRATLSPQRSSNKNLEPGAWHHSWAASGGGVAAASSVAEKEEMPRTPELTKLELTRQQRAEFVARGMKHYEALRPQLQTAHGAHVAISVKTGDYITTRSDTELKAFAKSLKTDDFLWITRVK